MTASHELPEKEPCRCNCGPSCGGKCGLGSLECAQKHFVRDCDHDFSEWRNTDWGGTMVCTKCGVTCIGHDTRVGP